METEVWIEIVVLVECDDDGKVELRDVERDVFSALETLTKTGKYHIDNVALGLGF